MKTRHWLTLLVATLASQTNVNALTPPSASDGPIKLLTCVVNPNGTLEAEVESQTDDAMSCNVRCNYELGERMFSYTFEVTIPARFHGRVGNFDTTNAKAGNYKGDLGNCRKIPR
jgi:hypothetical protein